MPLIIAAFLTLPLYVAELVGLLSFYERFFPRFVYNFTVAYNEMMKEKKRELFRNLDKFFPPKGSLRILELGCGSGANFEHYPTGCRITCIDPNPHFQKYLEKSMVKNDHLIYDSFIVASGENLKAVEIIHPPHRVDQVVDCGLWNVGPLLECWLNQEGGQHFFTPLYVCMYVCICILVEYYRNNGCDTTRATQKHLEAACFSDLQLRHIQAPLFFMLKPHIVGHAVK
uniref:Methyltransferase type 11 domain-containing protein n=1 Tax=Sinocyclocheilus grahami TaxID=75366 RepID=A0A672SWT7_SINGR